MDKITIARHIKYEFGQFRNFIEAHKEQLRISGLLSENGYEVNGISALNGIYATKNGLRFRCGRYSSEYTLHTDYCVYIVGGSSEKELYVSIFDIDKRIDEILNAGYVLPENHYVRPQEVDDIISDIKKQIAEAKELAKGGYGEIGDKMRRKGYYVSYDGSSVCNFSKGYMCFGAYCEYGKGWYLEDKYNTYLNGGDDLSARFSLQDRDRGFLLEEDFEAIFGGVPVFGGRLTEKDRIGEYTKFRVRTYGSKELNTIGYYDTFEEAKKVAYDKAKEYAEGVKDDRRRYAYTNPLDVSDKYDYLAAYIWYMYDRGSEHMVFVQGEN